MHPFARAKAFRCTAAAASMALAVGFSPVAAAALVNPVHPKVPLPKPRPISRSIVPKTTAAANPGQPISLDAAAVAPVIQPATRQHATLPPARKTPPPAIAATASTSQADTDAVQNVIELVRARKPADATQVEATI